MNEKEEPLIPKRSDHFRKRAFKTVNQLKKRIEKYFHDCEESGKHLQMVGLYLSLGICQEVGSRYLKGDKNDRKNDFSSILRRAKDWIELDKTERALDGKVPMPMAIFDLKANHGKLEVSRQEITGIDGAELVPAINFNFHSENKESDNK